jgi:putative transposase
VHIALKFRIDPTNCNKARLKVASIHEKIVNACRDFLHNLSTKLIRVICLLGGLESEEYSQESQAGEIHYECVSVGVRCDAGQFPSSQLCSGCGDRNKEVMT